jgi:hypothetical protein
MPEFKVASRHRAAGLGWMYVANGEPDMYAGAPPVEHPDPKQSGQNPDFAPYCWERLKTYVASDDFYRKQVDQHLAELDKDLARATASVKAAIDELDRAQAERDQVATLLPADSESSITTEQGVS